MKPQDCAGQNPYRCISGNHANNAQGVSRKPHKVSQRVGQGRGYVPQVVCQPNEAGPICNNTAHVFGTSMVPSFLVQSMTDLQWFRVNSSQC